MILVVVRSTFHPIASVSEFVGWPGQFDAPFFPHPERPRVFQEHFVHVSVAQLANGLDLLRGQRRAEEFVVLLLQNAKRHGDDHVVSWEFFAVATLHHRSGARVVDRAPSNATDRLAVSVKWERRNLAWMLIRKICLVDRNDSSSLNNSNSSSVNNNNSSSVNNNSLLSVNNNNSSSINNK